MGREHRRPTGPRCSLALRRRAAARRGKVGIGAWAGGLRAPRLQCRTSLPSAASPGAQKTVVARYRSPNRGRTRRPTEESRGMTERQIHTVSAEIAGRTLTLETGRFAEQADGAVTVR